MRHSILAALLAATALIPSAAIAQRGDDDRRGDRGFNRNPSGVTVESRLGVDRDGPDRAERPDRPQFQQQPQPQPQFQPRNDRGDDGARGDRGARGDDGARADRGARDRDRNVDRAGGMDRSGQGSFRPAPASGTQPDRPGFRDPDRRGGDVRVDRGAVGQWRGSANRGERGDWRDDRQRGSVDWRGNADRGGDAWRGGDRRNDGRYDRGRGNQGNWNRGWRQDNRYDWNRRRQYNRNAFHLPRYYAPSGWGYGYRRFNVGITLNSGLFNRNYWIDDADYYGLPEAYGPYRWVRYYNDALLVDVYSGQVVDTVYDIFW